MAAFQIGLLLVRCLLPVFFERNLAAVVFLPRLACYASIAISKSRLQSI